MMDMIVDAEDISDHIETANGVLSVANGITPGFQTRAYRYPWLVVIRRPGKPTEIWVGGKKLEKGGVARFFRALPGAIAEKAWDIARSAADPELNPVAMNGTKSAGGCPPSFRSLLD
jgi:hypothetical protein